eukprot:Hpha_TRINITY_DN15679_c2_g2::TRINITY_DN15679_c2_g2_i1::g.97365::m.97365
MCSRLLGLLVREGDTSEDVQTKKLAFPACAVLVVPSITTAYNCLILNLYAYALGAALVAFGSGVFMTGVLLNMMTPGRLVDVCLVISTVGIYVMDMSAAATSNTLRPWCFVVLALDAALVFNRTHIVYFVIPATLVYIAADAIESMHNYGLYEFGYWGADKSASDCDCASPPCSRGVLSAGNALIAMYALLLIDFHLTRGFAKSTRFQLRRMKGLVAVTGKIAAALARYDIDVAEEAITSGGELPSELVESFMQILHNLRSYKAYLPQSCLV